MKYFYLRITSAALGLAIFLSIALALLLAMTTATFAQSGEKQERMKEGREEAREAAAVLGEIMKKPDDFIPRELLEHAHAIAVIPDVVKAAFIVGGRGGDGVVARRTATGWSVPVFYDMGGTSFGAQIGAKKTDYIMLFMNEGALRDLLDEKVEFGAGASFAAGPIGRTAGAGTNPTLDAGILTWSRSEGAFIGASVKGAVLTADNDVNRAVYGTTAKEILANPSMVKMNSMPTEIDSFVRTLGNYAGNKMVGGAMNNRPNNFTYAEASFANNQNRQKEFAKMRSPQRLAREISNELLTLPYYSVFDWIEFRVNNDGVVTLSGQVIAPPDTKRAAAAYVKDVDGVTRVVNNIEILPVSPNDDRLRQALYREIYSGPLFRYQTGALQNIHIIVRNGRAALKGIVDSQTDKNLAGVRAKFVPGLFEVTNELVVRGNGDEM